MTVLRGGEGPVAARRWGGWALALALLAAAAPVALVRIPPMLDYPNHYVRLWLLEGGAARAPVSAMYAVDWRGASTNIAVDLAAAAARGLLPVSIVAPLMLALALVLPALGVAALGRRLFRTTSAWHVLCVLLAWNWVLLAGFLNFEISLGLALLAAAADGALDGRPAWMRAVLRIACATAILVAHPFGLLFYAALLAGLALGPSLPALLAPRALGGATVRVAAVAVAVAAPVAVLVLLAPALPGASGKARAATLILWQQPSLKTYASMLMCAFKSYKLALDVAVVAVLAAPPLVALALGRLRAHAGLLAVAAVLFIGCFLMPRQILSTGGIDSRLPCMLALTLAAALLPDGRPPRAFARMAPWAAPWIATGAALLLVCARAAWIGDVWVTRQADFASLERALAHVPAGSAVLPMEHLPDAAGVARAPLGRFIGSRTPSFWHYPTLAIMDRGAFVPTLFTAAGKQPVRVRPPWSSLAVAEGPLETVDTLAGADPAALARSPYLARWRECFDFILVVDADLPNARGPLPASPDIRPVADEGFAQLYRIVRSRSDSGCRAGRTPAL